MSLREKIATTDVFARVSPEHKVRIVDALRESGEIVAMTGDGVNDAPALKSSDIGVAMGITGTDVAKETADMVLTDDNFASIVAAVEQGRIIYANIRKFVFYLLSCNLAEIAVIFVAILAGLPSPLTPIQLLWLNLITDGAPALALGMEKGDPDTMQRPPRPPQEPVINRPMRVRIGIQTIAIAAVTLAAYLLGIAMFPGYSRRGQDDGLRDPLLFRAPARLHRSVGYLPAAAHRDHQQPRYALRGGNFTPAAFGRHLCALPAADLQHRIPWLDRVARGSAASVHSGSCCRVDQVGEQS